MFHTNELIKVGEWVKQNFVGDFWFSIAKGFEDTYIIVEMVRGCREGRQVYALSEILRGE